MERVQKRRSIACKNIARKCSSHETIAHLDNGCRNETHTTDVTVVVDLSTSFNLMGVVKLRSFAVNDMPLCHYACAGFCRDTVETQMLLDAVIVTHQRWRRPSPSRNVKVYQSQ